MAKRRGEIRIIIQNSQAVRPKNSDIIFNCNLFDLFFHFNTFRTHLSETSADYYGMSNSFCACCFITSNTNGAGIAITVNAISSGISSIEGKHFKPKTFLYFGFTGYIFPLNPISRRFFRMMPGRLFDFSVAPTIATEEGLKKFPCMFYMLLCQ